jgi:hypothetical protein
LRGLGRYLEGCIAEERMDGFQTQDYGYERSAFDASPDDREMRRSMGRRSPRGSGARAACAAAVA